MSATKLSPCTIHYRFSIQFKYPYKYYTILILYPFLCCRKEKKEKRKGKKRKGKRKEKKNNPLI